MATEIIKLQSLPEIDSSELWFINFSVGWCFLCKQLEPTFQSLSEAPSLTRLNFKLKLGQVDCQLQKPLCLHFKVDNYPTLLVLGNGFHSLEYQGELDGKSLVNFLTDTGLPTQLTRSLARWNRLEPVSELGTVLELDEDKLARLFVSEGVWLVEFYAPQCPHCQALAPKFTQVALLAQHQVNLSRLNCVRYPQLCTRFQVRGVPDLRYFVPQLQGNRSDHNLTGVRSAQELLWETQRYFQPQVLNLAATQQPPLGSGVPGTVVLTGKLDPEQLDTVKQDLRGSPLPLYLKEGGEGGPSVTVSIGDWSRTYPLPVPRFVLRSLAFRANATLWPTQPFTSQPKQATRCHFLLVQPQPHQHPNQIQTHLLQFQVSWLPQLPSLANQFQAKFKDYFCFIPYVIGHPSQLHRQFQLEQPVSSVLVSPNFQGYFPIDLIDWQNTDIKDSVQTFNQLLTTFDNSNLKMLPLVEVVPVATLFSYWWLPTLQLTTLLAFIYLIYKQLFHRKLYSKVETSQDMELQS